MRTANRVLQSCSLVIAAMCGTCFAADEPYLLLVGRLYAGVESPRIAKDYCATAQPSMTRSIAAQYEAWVQRNAAFLSRASEQFARANERLKSQGTSLSQTDASLLQQIRKAESGKFCRAYADILKAKESQFSGELGELLESVTRADAELTKVPTAR